MYSDSNQPNYNVFVGIMLAIVFLLSAISYLTMRRNIDTNQIQDPYTKNQFGYARSLNGWIMFLLAVTFVVYGYSLVKS
jgi:hypothetical protein